MSQQQRQTPPLIRIRPEDTHEFFILKQPYHWLIGIELGGGEGVAGPAADLPLFGSLCQNLSDVLVGKGFPLLHLDLLLRHLLVGPILEQLCNVGAVILRIRCIDAPQNCFIQSCMIRLTSQLNIRSLLKTP